MIFLPLQSTSGIHAFESQYPIFYECTTIKTNDNYFIMYLQESRTTWLIDETNIEQQKKEDYYFYFCLLEFIFLHKI